MEENNNYDDKFKIIDNHLKSIREQQDERNTNIKKTHELLDEQNKRITYQTEYISLEQQKQTNQLKYIKYGVLTGVILFGLNILANIYFHYDKKFNKKIYKIE